MTLLFFRRFAALAETLTVLALGNVVGFGIYRLLAPATIDAGKASLATEAIWDGILIFFRLGAAALFGFWLLYYRCGITPRQAGLTRNGRPLGQLLRTGLLLGVVTTIPISLLFSARALVPFGEGLATWWSYGEQEINTDFWLSVLGTSLLVPPLVEEIFTRGYQRARLVESYGAMGGVTLTGLVFAVSHTRYLEADIMLLLFMATLMFSSICWTYVAHRTGSVIPALTAHAVTNGTATVILFEVWLPLVVLLLIALVLRRPILQTTIQFLQDWKGDSDRHSIWTGVAALAAIFLPGLILLPLLGRLPTLICIGSLLLLVTIASLIQEKRTNPEAP